MNTHFSIQTTNEKIQKKEKILNILRNHIVKQNAAASIKDQIRIIRKIYMIIVKQFELLLLHPNIAFLKVSYKKGFDLISDMESKIKQDTTSFIFDTGTLRIGKYMKQNVQTFQKKYKKYVHEINCILMKKIGISDLLPVIKSYLL